MEKIFSFYDFDVYFLWKTYSAFCDKAGFGYGARVEDMRRNSGVDTFENSILPLIKFSFNKIFFLHTRISNKNFLETSICFSNLSSDQAFTKTK